VAQIGLGGVIVRGFDGSAYPKAAILGDINFSPRNSSIDTTIWVARRRPIRPLSGRVGDRYDERRRRGHFAVVTVRLRDFPS